MSNDIKHTEENPLIHHPENDSKYSGLQVNSGVVQPPMVSPYLKRGKRRQRSVNG